MSVINRTFLLVFVLYFSLNSVECAKINTPRVLLPWLENLNVNFTFEIIEGGCYSWSLSRDDIIDIEPLYEDTWGHCSRAARVSVSRSCASPGSVIILAEEVSTGEILRGDVDIDQISLLKVTSTTWKLYLEEAPEAFEVVAYDDQGNTFSTLEGISFEWSIKNLGSNVGEDPLVTLVRWRDTDYEAPRGVSSQEALGLRASTVLLYGQAMGECAVTACLGEVCAEFTLSVVASVVLTPAVAVIAPGDTLRYRVVRARAGRLTVQDVSDTLYRLSVPDSAVAALEDAVSLVRGGDVGAASVRLMSGATEVATAALTVAEPHSIKVSLRPSRLLVRGEPFAVHCAAVAADGHVLTAGDRTLIRLHVEGPAAVDLLRSTENGTLTDAVAQFAGDFVVTARLYSIDGRSLSRKVEGSTSGVAVDPLEVIPPELYVAWTESVQEIALLHRGGGSEPVTWSEAEGESAQHALSLSDAGVVSVRGVGEIGVKVQLKKFGYIRAFGRVWSAVPEYIQVSSSGQARVGKPHHLHVALTGTHPVTGELFNFHRCDCASFAVSLLEGPEPFNVTAATYVQPAEGACCVLEASWRERGVSTVRVSRGRVGDTARVSVRAAPRLVWPLAAAALVGEALPVLALGDALLPASSEPRISELTFRDGPPPHRHPDIQLFTVKCKRKGESRLQLTSQSEEPESVELEVACAPHVSRARLDPPETPGNCEGGPRLWLVPGHEVKVKVTLFDAIGRELLDERGPKTTWETSPKHAGIEYRAADRLFIETHPEYVPVAVPYKYYQVVIADEQAIGWAGALKASIPEATASIQAKVVAPLLVEPLKVNVAWEGESLSSVANVSGGSGRHVVDAVGVTARVEDGKVVAIVPAPGTYQLRVEDLCVQQSAIIELNVEEILTVEVSTSPAVCTDACVPITAVSRGASRRLLSHGGAAEWRVAGDVRVQGGRLCGVREGVGRVRAGVGGVWSAEVEILVFPPLSIIPADVRLPAGAKLQLSHQGGPPPHLATLQYAGTAGNNYVEVSGSGMVHGLAIGKSHVKLVARDVSGAEMTSADAHVEVIPITNLRIHVATQTLLVGAPCPLWLEADGLGTRVLAALQPRVTWTVREHAHLYTTHRDDKLERTIAEGLTVRVVPLKAGLITIDVRVRNMGQLGESRTWDSTVEIFAVTDIQTSVEGLPQPFPTPERLALAVGSVVRLKTSPRSEYKAYSEDGALEVSALGEVRGVRAGHGAVRVAHTHERARLYREHIIHIEVATPHYCTLEPAEDEDAVRIVLRNSVGRALLAPEANATVYPLNLHPRRAANSALGSELVTSGVPASGALVTAESGGTRDEVWLTGPDTHSQRYIVSAGRPLCLPGAGWRAPDDVTLHVVDDVTIALLARDGTGKHQLRGDRPTRLATIHQVQIEKMSFLAGDWPASFVPLSLAAEGATADMVMCTEQQRETLAGVQVQLPFECVTAAPHLAEAKLDVAEGRIGCSITPSLPITTATSVEVCASLGRHRTCARAALLPPAHLTPSTVSLLAPPAIFTVTGDPAVLARLKVTPSPGLTVTSRAGEGVVTVTVAGEDATCGAGWVLVESRRTAQEWRVEVQKECSTACGTLLGALFALLSPHLSTLATLAGVVAAYVLIQSRLSPKVSVRLPAAHPAPTPPPSPPRTWARSPYASAPASPVYGDASLSERSFSPDHTRVHSRFL